MAFPASDPGKERRLPLWGIAMACTLAVALAGRTFRLLSMFPMLVDESIYLRWAEIIHHQHRWFISLLDGKQPLSYWIYSLVGAVWPSDPLFGGRLVSVFAGLLSTGGIYLLGRRLSGETAGVMGALLYAVLPYAIFYDRLAYTDALVNTLGIAIVYTSVAHFDSAEAGWKSAVWAGLALGIGFFIKSSAALFAFVPALCCLLFDRERWRSLGAIYGIAAIFPLISALSVPNAPRFSTTSLLFHREDFFTPFQVLLTDPLFNARFNAPLLLAYLQNYVTAVELALAVAGFVIVLRKKPKHALLMGSLFAIPLLFQVMMLQYFPSRYCFPFVWPCLLLVALAAAGYAERRKFRGFGIVAALLLAGPLAAQSVGVLLAPERYLFVEDAEQFLGSNPYAGWGVRRAADYLLAESRNGPYVLLTDPYWGPPADAMFVYLNQRNGIRVHEAWWLELPKAAPILPTDEMPLMRSHYERVRAEVLDFRKVARVFYVTDTGYSSTADVHKREPGARLVASFKKPNGVDSIDVYRLK